MNERTTKSTAAELIPMDRLEAARYLALYERDEDVIPSVLDWMENLGHPEAAQEMALLMVSKAIYTTGTQRLIAAAPIERFQAVLALPLEKRDSAIYHLARFALWEDRFDVMADLYGDRGFTKYPLINILSLLPHLAHECRAPEISRMLDAGVDPHLLARGLLATDIGLYIDFMIPVALTLGDDRLNPSLHKVLTGWLKRNRIHESREHLLQMHEVLEARRLLIQSAPAAVTMMAAP